MEWIQSMDVAMLTGLRDVFDSPVLDKCMIFITKLGDGGLIWIAIAILLMLFGNKKYPWRTWGLTLALCLAATALFCNGILKPMVARMRPYDLLGYEILVARLGDFSFPSGHTAAAFASATAIYSMNKKWGTSTFVLAAFMGFSRLYLGVHYPSDVLAGAFLGWFIATITIFAFRRFALKNKSRI